MSNENQEKENPRETGNLNTQQPPQLNYRYTEEINELMDEQLNNESPLWRSGINYYLSGLKSATKAQDKPKAAA